MSLTTTPPATARLVVTRAITDRFQYLAGAEANRIAVIDRDRAVTFAQLWRMAYQHVADRLPSRRIVPVLGLPTAGTIAEALAVWLCEGIPLPIPLGIRAKPIDAAIAQAARTAHWCQPWRAHLHGEYGGRHIWVAGGEPPTTSRLGDAIGLVAGGTALVAAPLYAAAIFEVVIRQLLAGSTVVLQPDFTPDGWLHTAVQTSADWAVLALGQTKALLRYREQLPNRLRAGTRTLRNVVVPATLAPAGTNYLADFADAADVTATTWYHAPAYDGATTMTTGVASALAPVPGLRLRTVDPTGQPTPPGVAGLIEASSVDCAAVAHRADQPCPPARQWRTSGDIGNLTNDGHLAVHRLEPAEHYLSPRGQRLRGTALRRTVAAHPDVSAVAVHIVPDEHGRARAQLRVWTRPGIAKPLTASAVAAYCSARDVPVFAEHVLIAAVPTRRGPTAPR